MPEFVELYWPYLAVAAVVLFGLIWFLIAANRKTSVISEEKKDVLDEGAAPAARNQALIDSPTATEPAAAPDPTPQTPMDAGDDLTTIKGLGPKLAVTLNELGVTSYAQIAAWDDSEIDRIDSQLGRFSGRIRRDNWVEQAKLLSSGDESGFASKFGQNS
jgi:predicted flap endonuclease-1-like 5' DNA nuclease